MDSLDSSNSVTVGYVLDGQGSVPGTDKNALFYIVTKLDCEATQHQIQ
jgi:hypothetical protein